MRRAALLAIVVGLAASAHAQVDSADTVAYRLRTGDTLDVVAAEFYGDKTQAVFLVAENHLLDGKTHKLHGVSAGDRIKVPVTREIATAKGDTFESLAQTYLGDARRASFLADYNGIAIDDSLAAGTLLTIPMRVNHTATNGESLAAIASQYYGDPRQADVLRRYNNLDKNSLDKGEMIVVPNLRVHVRAARQPPLDPESKDRRDRQKKALAEAADALPRARSAWLLGDFAGVKTALLHVADSVDFLDAKTAIEVGILLGKAHVAFDEKDDAVAAFARVIDRRPRTLLSPYADSPKVLEVWRKAGGHVEGE